MPGCLDEGKILFVSHLVFIEIERADENSPCRLVVFQQGGKPLQIIVRKAVRAAADGEALIAPSVTVRLLRAFADVPAGRPAVQPISPVTAREEEVLLAVARGLTNTEIADTLHISLSTVKTHLASLMAKLGARNRVEIAMWAYETHRIIPGT